MENNFIPAHPINTKTLKERIEDIYQSAITSGNTQLISKASAIKGMYSAYEITPTLPLMEAIALAIAELFELSRLTPIHVVPVITTPSKHRSGIIYILFEEYLIESGLVNPDGTPTATVGLYVRAIKRLINKYESESTALMSLISVLAEIIGSSDFDINNVDTLIRIRGTILEILSVMKNDERERERSKKDHGVKVCALKAFLRFIEELIRRLQAQNPNLIY